jgi:hypothetical protein
MLSIIEPEGKAVTRTFRLDRAWDRVLEEEAEKRKMSVSNLLENIVSDYSHFYRWVEVLHAITFSPGTFKEFLEAIDEEELKRIGEKVGKMVPVHGFLVRGDKITPEVARYLVTQLMGKYGNWCRVADHENQRAYYYIKHDYGPKWSVFLGAYVSSFYANVLGKKIECEPVADNLLIKFVD